MPRAATQKVETLNRPAEMLKVHTFSNRSGGNALFKALSHPLAARAAETLITRLAAAGPVAVYDPAGQFSDFAAFYDLSRLDIAGIYVQQVADIGKHILGHMTRPVTEIGSAAAKMIFLACFDAQRPLDQVRHLLPTGAAIAALDEMRLPEEFVRQKRSYLDLLNFATNFALFRDADGMHTRLTTANYWANYGAKNVALWCCLFGETGDVLAEWTERLKDGPQLVVIDSADIRRRFGLGDFTGSLFVHAIGAAGHDIVKYALDIYGREAALSCSHDANAWPADLYAGIPAPRAGERVLLWIENSSPHPIPRGAIGLNHMGGADVVSCNPEIAPFASYALDIGEWLPGARWPEQLELRAGRYFVRPRYEIIAANGHRRIAHANVERTDLKPDAGLPSLTAMGKGYLLPAPILPPDRFATIALPTPMSTVQEHLPLALTLYDASGEEVLRHGLGCLKRSDSAALDIAALLKDAGKTLPSGYGHLELTYDFAAGSEADGWLHALFRYERRDTGHAAETSFGAHMFNTALVYKDEPQSYAGKAPGLSTRLFLRLGHDGLDALCHLIYPVSTRWHAASQTDLILQDAAGVEIARRRVAIPMSGSLLWRYSEMFDAETRTKASGGGYIIVRDTTCRLFGYHGLVQNDAAFSFDHMFGF
jgi:hypothetical protein